MAKAKSTSSANTQTHFHHLCSIEVRTGEQEYVIYELRAGSEPLAETDYRREVLEFCRGTSGAHYDIAERLAHIEDSGRFEEFAYDDRMYIDPWVQDVFEAEYTVLQKYLRCR